MGFFPKLKLNHLRKLHGDLQFSFGMPRAQKYPLSLYKWPQRGTTHRNPENLEMRKTYVQ